MAVSDAPKPRKSRPFAAFAAAQIQVNEFLWSSELSYTLVERIVLTPEIRDGDPGVHQAFADLRPKPHAFIPPSRARDLLRAGKTPRRTVKYDVPISAFDRQLKANFEALCRYVIIRFHSALERFLWERAEPFLNLAALAPEARKNRRKQYQETPYQNWQKATRRWIDLPLRAEVPRASGLIAQAHRMVRNGIIHKEIDWHLPWSDAALLAAVRTSFSARDRDLIIDQLCDPIRQRIGQRKDVPILFFYALFSLTAYRKLAELVESALPPETDKTK
jgi:hypothetical protein